MPRPRPANLDGPHQQMTLRLPQLWFDRLDQTAIAISKPGFPATRTDALRRALSIGLDAIDAEAKAAKDAVRAAKGKV